MSFFVFFCHKLQIQGESNSLTPAAMGTLEGLRGQIKKVLQGLYHLNLKTDFFGARHKLGVVHNFFRGLINF